MAMQFVADDDALNVDVDRIPIGSIPNTVLYLRNFLLIAQYRGYTCLNGIIAQRIVALRGRYAAQFGRKLSESL